MRWIKLGLLFPPPQGRLSWLQDYSAVPTAMCLRDSLYRVYFSGRDSANRSHTGFFEMDLKAPANGVVLHNPAVLSPGPLGSFDEHGAMVSWIVPYRGSHYLYYTGWCRGASVPFMNSIGLAISSDGGVSFRKFSEGPLLGRNTTDPYWVSNPCVLVDDGMWRMWYLSGTRWEHEEPKPKPCYHIRYCQSDDGIHWRREGRVCIDFQSPGEHAISRPCVLKEDGIYKMWYSYRGASYRIGYAESADGLHWTRLDAEAGIDVSATGWDSEMIEYAFVVNHRGTHYAFYNGNGFGRTGIGLARCQT